jgi:rRNA 2'-O-methyltransferase fibrillarin
VKEPAAEGEEAVTKEYRTWSVYRSKLAAAIACGAKDIYIKPGSSVLYLGASSGTTVSHVSDLVGPTGIVYAVEYFPRSGRDLVDMSQRRPNIVPIIEDARQPVRYRMLVGQVDTIFMDVAQPNQAQILALNAHYFLKTDGHYVLSIKANCIDSTADPETVYASEIEKMKKDGLKPKAQISVDTFERGHAVVIGTYRPTKK